MSKKTKLGDIPLTVLTMEGCVVSPDNRFNRPTINIDKPDEDPGAIHIVFNTKDDWYGILRAVYDPKAANVPKADKPETEAYRIKAGYDDVTVIFGNYNITDDMLKQDDDAHVLLTDLLMIVTSNQTGKTYHDAEGFMLLSPTTQFMDGFWKLRPLIPPRDTQCPELTIRCHGVNRDDENIISIVNAITMFSSRVNVRYNAYPQYYGDRILLNPSCSMHLLQRDATKEVISAIGRFGFDGDLGNAFLSTFLNAFKKADEEDDARRTSRVHYTHIEDLY